MLDQELRGGSMNETIIITIPIDTGNLSPNKTRGLHWSKLVKLKQKVAMAVLVGWSKAGKPKLDCPVNVSIVARRARTMDEDNLIASMKMLQDLLFKDAVTKDDSPEWVKISGVSQEINRKYTYCPEVEFRVERR
jgi:hypothetical protein